MSDQISTYGGQRMPAQTSEETTSTFTCDFCQVSFKCDIDVSRHLMSSTHVKNRDTFINLQGQNKNTTDKHTPKNWSQVLESLKLRNVKDLRDLADKGYFEIVDENAAGIAEELAKVLFRSIIEHDLKDLPSGIRDQFLELLKVQEQAGQAKSNAPKPCTSSSIPRQNATTSSNLAKENSTSTRPNAAPKLNPPKPTPPVIPTRVPTTPPIRNLTPLTTASKPIQPTPGSSRQSTPMPNRQRPPTSANQDRPILPPTQAFSFRTPAPVRAREAPRPQTNPRRDPQTQEETPKTGPPQPRKDSTYIPQLAKIKVEPRDS